MAQFREALVIQADRLREIGQQMQEEVKVLKFNVNMNLEQRNFYSIQIEYYSTVLRRLAENSARYQRRGAQLEEAFDREQCASDELLRIYESIGDKQQEIDKDLAKEKEICSQVDQIDSYKKKIDISVQILSI